MHSGSKFFFDFELLKRGFGKQIALLFKGLHKLMSSLAHLQFFEDVPSGLLVFGDSKRCILEPRGARGENFCIGSSNLHPTPKKPSKSGSKSVPKPSSGASQDSWNGLPKAATLKIRFLRRELSGGSEVSSPGPGKWDPGYI